jgi:GTPase SAR1 family protein
VLSINTLYFTANNIGESAAYLLLESLIHCNLIELKIDDEYIPDELQNKSINNIRQYFKDLKKGKEKSKQIKLLIIGEEGHGKTSLLYFLKENKSISKPTKSTDGIEVESWKIKDKNKKEITISTWDFAGQKVRRKKNYYYYLFFL